MPSPKIRKLRSYHKPPPEVRGAAWHGRPENFELSTTDIGWVPQNVVKNLFICDILYPNYVTIMETWLDDFMYFQGEEWL
jgi:hypothetical protein